jgi:hypothetical protein
VDKDLLFKPRLAEDVVEIPGIGGIRVRALNRQEAKRVQAIASDDERDLHMLAIGIVDPPLSVSEVRRWAEASPAGEMEPVSERIAELSGMLPSSPKEAMKNFEAEPADEFRILPGSEVGDDGRSAPGGNE